MEWKEWNLDSRPISGQMALKVMQSAVHPHLSIKKKQEPRSHPNVRANPCGQVKLSPETTILHFPSSMISLVQKPVYFPMSSSQAPRDPSFGLQIIPRPPKEVAWPWRDISSKVLIFRTVGWSTCTKKKEVVSNSFTPFCSQCMNDHSDHSVSTERPGPWFGGLFWSLS